MKKPVPTFDPIIRSRNSHLIHLGDRANSSDKRFYFDKHTRCGRVLNDVDFVFSFVPELEPEMLLDERWKKFVHFNPRRRHKDPVLCTRCGGPGDFRLALVQREEYSKRSEAYLEFWRHREKELYQQFAHQYNNDMRVLWEAFAGNGSGIPVELDDSGTHFHLYAVVDGRRYSLTSTEDVHEKVSVILEAEKRKFNEENSDG
jgi:hypothetical protein